MNKHVQFVRSHALVHKIRHFFQNMSREILALRLQMSERLSVLAYPIPLVFIVLSALHVLAPLRFYIFQAEKLRRIIRLLL